jgi:hypothetical protein
MSAVRQLKNRLNTSPVDKKRLIRTVNYVYYFCTVPPFMRNGTKVLGTLRKLA